MQTILSFEKPYEMLELEYSNLNFVLEFRKKFIRKYFE